MNDEIESILVGTDFSKGANVAVALARFLAKHHGFQFRLGHIVDSHGIDELSDVIGVDRNSLVGELSGKAKERLETELRQHSWKQKPAVSVGFGEPRSLLVEQANGDNTLLLGAVGESGSGRGLGSVVSYCLRRAKTRVLVAKGRGHDISIRKIVACVDLSSRAKSVVAEAIRLAWRLDATVEFLHVYRPPWDRLHYRAPTPEASPHFQREFLDLLKERLDSVLQDVDYPQHERTLRAGTSFGVGISEYAGERNCDLLILGADREHPIREYYLGSTAERILGELPCSVMTVPVSS